MTIFNFFLLNIFKKQDPSQILTPILKLAKVKKLYRSKIHQKNYRSNKIIGQKR